MIAVDTSVVVAGLASWHEGHAVASLALKRGPRIPAHVLIESYSVLTRLPPPHRMQPDLVAELLRGRFRQAPLTLGGKGHVSLLRFAVEGPISGGAIYDALVGITAKRAAATLLTRDRRAVSTYDVVGVRYEFVG